MYDARRRDFALSASFVSELECFDGSEVTGKCNDSIVQKQNCVVEEIKEVELRSRRGKFIKNRTLYHSVGLNKVSHFSRRGRARSRLPMKKLKSLLQKTQKVRVLYGRIFGKIHHSHYRLKFIVTLKIHMVST